MGTDLRRLRAQQAVALLWLRARPEAILEWRGMTSHNPQPCHGRPQPRQCAMRAQSRIRCSRSVAWNWLIRAGLGRVAGDPVPDRGGSCRPLTSAAEFGCTLSSKCFTVPLPDHHRKGIARHRRTPLSVMDRPEAPQISISSRVIIIGGVTVDGRRPAGGCSDSATLVTRRRLCHVGWPLGEP